MKLRTKSKALATIGIACISMSSACTTAVETDESARDASPAEDVASVAAALSVPACSHFDAYDHYIGENWPNTTVYSDKVDLLETNDPAMHIYNAYNYDYSGQCPGTFVTDVVERPNGNPAMRFRGTIKFLVNTGPMTEARCNNIYFEYAVYGQKFGGDNSWIHIWNDYNNAVWSGGRCWLPSVTSTKIDWKDGISGFGKVTGLRFALSAGEGDVKVPTCLALDGDDSGANLNTLCPIRRY